tara:strand:- start:1458 stop:1754 length:297 start_codon:yes stop_codon:yes gene_type:complete
MTNSKFNKEERMDICKHLLMMGELCLFNFRVDPKTVGEKTEKMMIESLSMLQIMISEAVGIPKEEQLEAMKLLDGEMGRTRDRKIVDIDAGYSENMPN